MYMKTYCVRQKKKTDCLPGSETIRMAKNRRQMLVCQCAECGATKTQFVAGQSGGALKRDFACGYNLQGKRPGTKEECFRTGRIGYWGLNQLDDGEIDGLLHDRQFDRNRKARERRQAKKGALVEYKPPPAKTRKKDQLTKEEKKQLAKLKKEMNKELKMSEDIEIDPNIYQPGFLEMRGPPSKDQLRQANNLDFLINLMGKQANRMRTNAKPNVSAKRIQPKDQTEFLERMAEDVELAKKREKRYEEIRKTKGLPTMAQLRKAAIDRQAKNNARLITALVDDVRAKPRPRPRVRRGSF